MAAMLSRLPNTPILNASTGMSSSRQRAWSATHSASIAWIASTPRVSCTVIAVTTDKRMATHARKRQDVGLQAGAARRVRRGERQHDGREFGFGIGGHGGAAETAERGGIG